MLHIFLLFVLLQVDWIGARPEVGSEGSWTSYIRFLFSGYPLDLLFNFGNVQNRSKVAPPTFL